MTKSELRQIIREEISKFKKSSRINEVKKPSLAARIRMASEKEQEMTLFDISKEEGTVNYSTLKSKNNERHMSLMKDKKFGIEFDEKGVNQYEDDDEDQAEILKGETEDKNDLIKYLKSKRIPHEVMTKNRFTMVVIPIEYSNMG